MRTLSVDSATSANEELQTLICPSNSSTQPRNFTSVKSFAYFPSYLQNFTASPIRMSRNQWRCSYRNAEKILREAG